MEREEVSKMIKGRVSVVVPVYNVEQYLDRCVTSIVNQSYQDLEIILVDDGSPDRSPALCDAWAKKDSRIKVIHKANAGAGYARNTGIEHATGEYVCLFDSDDYVALHAIETVYKEAVDHQADIVIFGSATVDGSQTVCSTLIPEPAIYQGDAVMQQLLPALMGEDPRTGRDANMPFSLWSCFISMELIRRAQWRLVSEREIGSEDFYSLIELYGYVRKAVVLGECLYFYCLNGASISHSYHPDRYTRIRRFYLKCLELCESCGYPEEVVRRCREPFLGITICALKQEAAHHRSARAAVRRLKLIMDDELLQQVVWSKKQDKTNLKKALLYWSIRRRHYWICYAFIKAKNAASDQ